MSTQWHVEFLLRIYLNTTRFVFQTTSKLVDSRRVTACAIDLVRYLRCFGAEKRHWPDFLFACSPVFKLSLSEKNPILTKEVFESDRVRRKGWRKNNNVDAGAVSYRDRTESIRKSEGTQTKKRKGNKVNLKICQEESTRDLKQTQMQVPKNSCACSVNFQVRGYERVLRQSKVSARFPLKFLEFGYNRISIALT